MQVPKIFNYTILDNIVYGNKTAKNSEIAQAVETANCSDFITEGKVHKYNFSAESLLKTMKANQTALVQTMGTTKYNEEIIVLEHMQEQEDLEGQFQCEEELWDRLRNAECRDIEMPLGYQQSTGINGCQLSLDQKKRLQIARAIVFKPKVLVIDDVILGLEDEEIMEAKVEKALE